MSERERWRDFSTRWKLDEWTRKHERTTPALEQSAVETSSLNYSEHAHDLLLDVLAELATDKKPLRTTEAELQAAMNSYCLRRGIPPLSAEQLHDTVCDLCDWQYIRKGPLDLAENTPITVPIGFLEYRRQRKEFLTKARKDEIHREEIRPAFVGGNFTYIGENSGSIAIASKGSAHASVHRLLEEPIRDLQGKVDSIRWVEKDKKGLKRFMEDLVHAALRLDLDKFERAKVALTMFGADVFKLLEPAIEEISKILYQHC